ncbi:uncharacterized protein LOC109835233 [Asparagus officinalis]|uniref:uncharacterized protein LOC109835233 n=1 Tax=Asparagus officinalis TaxID=4686 RepID=UPI00098E4FF9|nr:uncharacterized protein LOC109835233 [Asparagus officinalis]
MEDILYYKDLHDPIKGDEAKPEKMTNKEWEKQHKKVIGYIQMWINVSVFHHVSGETNAKSLWKKLENLYEQKTTGNKVFIMRCWETLVVKVSNTAPNGVLSMSMVTSSLFNEETRRKSTSTDNSQALITENRGMSRTEPGTSQHNGVAKRYNRTIVEKQKTAATEDPHRPPASDGEAGPNCPPSLLPSSSSLFGRRARRSSTVFVGDEGVPLEGVIRFEKPDATPSRLISWAQVGLLAGGDVLCLLLFSAIGRFSHGFPVLDFETLKTADPFIAGWFLGAYFLGAYGDDGKGLNGTSKAITATAKSWLVGIPLGIVVRAATSGHIPSTAFMLVSMGSTGILLIGWRALISKFLPSKQTKKSDVYKRGSAFELFELLTSLVRRW